MLKWFRRWRLNRAIAASNKRMSGYTKEQRRELFVRGINMIHPNGYWVCHHGSMNIYNSHGEACRVCGKKQSEPVEVARK